MVRRRKTITELARELRKNPTDSERLLWEILRKRRLNGYRFVRQKPFIYGQNQKQRFFFIADFYCAEKKTVVELDGPIHKYTRYYDYQRDLVMKKRSLRSLRLSNGELTNLVTVKKKILNFLVQQQY